MSQLLILEILTPVCLALLCLLFSNDKIARIFTIASSIVTFVIPFFLESKIGTSYVAGSWPAQFGIEFKITHLNLLFLYIINTCTLSATIYRFFEPCNYLKSALFLLSQAGFLGILLSNDAFNIYVFLEISSLASYALIAMSENIGAVKSALNYLIVGTISATFYLLGVGFIYLFSGNLNISSISSRRAEYDYMPHLLKPALFFISCGLFGKLALVPLQSWLVQVYRYSTASLNAYLAGTSSKTNIYMLLFVTLTIFGHKNLDRYHFFDLLLIVGGIGSVWGGFKAFRAYEIRNVIAFSSISQIGTIVLAFSLNSIGGIASGIIQTISHAFAKPTLFMLENRALEQNFRGPERFFYFIGVATLVGFPPAIGFFAKWSIFVECLRAENYWAFGFMVMSSIFSILYGLRLFSFSFKTHEKSAGQVELSSSITSIIASGILVIAQIVPLFYYSALKEFLAQIGQTLLQN